MADQQEPADHSEDPRKQGTGQGYPESGQAGATPHEGTDEGPEADTPDADAANAPSTSSDAEDDREASTGNAGAAG